MAISLWRQHVLPFVFLTGLLAAVTIAGDYILHLLNLAWVGRYLGIAGTILIFASLIYSLRKRKYIKMGNPKTLLAMHEFGTWIGSSLVLIHAGVHFNAILPWLATVAMGVNAVSGMVGKLLLDRSRSHLKEQREHFQLRGMSRSDVERAMFWDAVTFDAMNRWRKVHIPIFVVFAVLSLGHIVGIFLFWGWK